MDELGTKSSDPHEVFDHTEESLQDLNIEDLEESEEDEDPKQKGDRTGPRSQCMQRKVSSITESGQHALNEESFPARNLPKVNCPEKIVLCLDLSKEVEDTTFVLGNGQRFTGVQMVKRALEIFVQTKHVMDSRHQFALAILTDSCVWLTNFTNNTKEICDVLKDLNETLDHQSCNLSSLFSGILERTEIPEVLIDPEVFPPQFVVRAVIIYGRSQTIPIIDENSPSFRKLQASDYFFLDYLYIHLPPAEDNMCQTIFERFCDLDHKYTSYVLDVTRSATKVHNQAAVLLAHPLLRPVQKDAHYKIQQIPIIC